MRYTFLALLFRMKHIPRWSLMYNTQPEYLDQHTLKCSLIALYLAHIGNSIYGKNYDANKLAIHALHHDATEVLTGDLPTPIKYFSPEMRASYRKIEKAAINELLRRLPIELQEAYRSYFTFESLTKEEKNLIKTADKLSDYIKCLQEVYASNNEFEPAQISIKKQLDEIGCDESTYFLDNCLHSFISPIDYIIK